jgi:hypothetical protein
MAQILLQEMFLEDLEVLQELNGAGTRGSGAGTRGSGGGGV